MSKKRNSFVSAQFILVILLFLIGTGILWLGVPMLAEGSFGKPSTQLSSVRIWTLSAKLLFKKGVIINSVSISNINIPFTIANGATVTSIAVELEEKGLIQEALVFRDYVIYKGFDTELQAGDYDLPPSLPLVQIVEALQANYSPVVSFYIYPGWRAEEIAASLPSSGIEVSPEQYITVVQNPSGITLPEGFQGANSLEGLMFPGEYQIDRKISATDLAQLFVNRFSESVSMENRSELQSHGLSLYQSIVLASIIQKETFDDSERPQIASVFYNRLAAGMKLETDPTVQYALGYDESWGGWWKTPLLVSDLSFQSPMNTYLISGLPEQPISNPDLPSLDAVAGPASTPYYYFRAKCDGSGSHVFSQTYEEHLANACN
ncbi:MAG: endolytic transglycosylase MltG [Chloroflexi bacterium]|nr:endolytic transglycosylase MltG [Chloroflexota bacterium]